MNKHILLERYCKEKFEANLNVFNKEQLEIITNTYGFIRYQFNIEIKILENEIIEEFKKIFKIGVKCIKNLFYQN